LQGRPAFQANSFEKDRAPLGDRAEVHDRASEPDNHESAPDVEVEESLMARWRIGPKMRQRLTTLLATAILGLLAAAAVAFYLPTKFTAHTTLFVYGHPGDSPQGGTLAEQLALNRVKSFTPLVTETSVMRDAGSRLGLADTPQQLAARTEVENLLDTVLIRISVTDAAPEQAARIANTIGEVFINAVNQFERPAQFDVIQHVAVKVVEPASVPTGPSSLPLQVVLALGFFAGLSVGIIVTLGRERTAARQGLVPYVAEPHEAAQLTAPRTPLREPIRAGQNGNNDARDSRNG
jgi:capsular polysaccharide biosynthesis protein